MPSETSLSARGNTSLPDAYISYKRDGASSQTRWWDIAIPFEFKKKNDEDSIKDDEAKIIWSLHNIMREDPCRRFALGITIEDKNIRVWCHNRAFLAASKPLDFTKEIDDVIALFYSIASKNEVELGWDPTVERVYDGDKVQYKFAIGGEIFTTIDELSTYGADAVIGRGTRVYEAKDKDGTVVAIKDSWRDQDRDTEGVILENIFEDIVAKFGQEEAEDVRRYFVQVCVSEDVEIFGELDKTLVFVGPDKLEWIEVDVKPIPSKKSYTTPKGHIESNHFLGILRRNFDTLYTQSELPMKVHTRTVFKDVGRPLKDVFCLSDSFKCLDGARQAGWVHRDFSVTNVLWFEVAQVGKLSDLEYAKKFDPHTTHDVRTGTMQFMAIEVETRSYHFKPTLCLDDLDDGSEDPPFHMNFLHDLESQWWVAIWVLFVHTDADSPTQTSNDQLRYATEAFPFAIRQASRHYFFTDEHLLWKAFKTLSATYKKRCKYLMASAMMLHEFYRTAEGSYPNMLLNDGFVDSVHAKMKGMYSATMEALEGSTIRLQPLSAKRRSEDLSISAEEPKKLKLHN